MRDTPVIIFKNNLTAKNTKFYAKAAKVTLMHFLCGVFSLRPDSYRDLRLICFCFFLLFTASSCSQTQKNLIIPYVNPFIGTAGHAHTFPGACYPFGMMQLSPDTRLTGWDGCSGYYYADDTIYGFTHTHLSGTGISDYGDILLMPISDEYFFGDTSANTYIGNYLSEFSHKDEKASPGYYSVILKRGNIKAELTVGERVGIHRYIYEKKTCEILLDLKHRNNVISSELKIVSDTEVCGYRETRAWTKDKIIYFDIRFSKPIVKRESFKNDLLLQNPYGDDTIPTLNRDMKGENLKAIFNFMFKDTIIVKVGISAVSVENAKENLVHDIPGWDFDGTLKKTQQAWNDYLNKIEVSTKTDSLLTTFYTALYHTAIHPSLYTDVNGQYSGRDNQIHTAKGFEMYTVFSLWDTYCALNPLWTIIDTAMTRQFILSFLKQYEQGGALPVWELSANETNCMIGYHAVSVIWDAYQKGMRGFDANEALAAMEHSADHYDRAHNLLEQYGYLPSDKCSESVSQTLECSYDDWCIAEMAKALGKTEDYNKYIALAQSYKNVFNPNNDFMQGRSNGAFVKPFDPRAVTFNYTEGNAWQYNFYAPQDMSGLIDLYGSREKLAMKLDTLFTTTSVTLGMQLPDITGMIGQYAQGNEPSHHIAYLYNYAGQPWKTQEYVRKIENLYTNQPDGICGNDDCGALSAWYVMSAMGLYQVCPGDGQFELTDPLFDTVKIHLENGKTFEIVAPHPHTLRGYKDIVEAKLNGVKYYKSYLKYTDLMKGDNLRLAHGDDMGLDEIAPEGWGMEKNVPVDSIPQKDQIIPQPYLEYESSIFTDSLEIVAKSYNPLDTTLIFRIMVDSAGNRKETALCPGNIPFYISESCSLGCSIKRGKSTVPDYWGRDLSDTLLPYYFSKIPKGRKIKVLSKANSQYTAGGQGALLDYQYGASDFRLGKWQGYQYQDFEAVVDLGKIETISEVGANFLQDVMSYIIMPTYVDFSVSTDSIHFTPVAHIANTLADTVKTPTIKDFTQKITTQKVRYVKVFAKNYGKLPLWHPGYPDSAFIFIDEIEIK